MKASDNSRSVCGSPFNAFRGALFCTAAMLAQGASASADNYPDYNVSAHCEAAFKAGSVQHKHHCEDLEFAISILLRQAWPDMNRTASNTLEFCAATNARFSDLPTYANLLQCVTRVRDIAD